ncbi:MAG: TolC family protein, partial [Deltaproteobacteria bacterium]|nr:TolC family protein [Deltaproteobacteria bacterium]
MPGSNRMRRFHFLLSAVLSVFLTVSMSSPSGAGEPLTLVGLLEEARANNPELRVFKERAGAKESRVGVEGALDDPTLKVEMMDLSKSYPLNIAPGNAMLTRYTVSQMFPFPGKLSLKEKIAVKEALSARAELAAKGLEIESSVKEAYFEYAFLVEAVRETEEIKALLINISSIAGVKYSTGQATQQDVLKAQVETTMLTNDIITLDAEKGVAAARLKSLVNMGQDSPLGEPAGLSKARAVFDAAALIDTAIKKNPEIRMAEFDAEANELNVELAKKNYYPDFMVGAAPIQRDGRFDSFDVMFQVNIPIWWGKYDSRTKEASADAQSLKWKALSQKNLKSLEVKGAAVQVEASDRMRSLYETGLLPQVELSFESALKNYGAGKIDFMTLLDAERQLKRTRIEY